MFKHLLVAILFSISIFYVHLLSIEIKENNAFNEQNDFEKLKKYTLKDIAQSKIEYFKFRKKIKYNQIHYCNYNSTAYLKALHGNINDITLRTLEYEVFKQNPDLKKINKYFNTVQTNFFVLKTSTFQANQMLENAIINIFSIDIANQGSFFFDNSLQDIPIVLQSVKDVAKEYNVVIDTVVINEAKEYLSKIKEIENFNKLDFTYKYEHLLFSAVRSKWESIYDENFIKSKFKYDNNTDKIKLGNILFYDPILSSNNKRACSSCHNPDLAFTDTLAKSLALDFNGNLDRNTPTIINSIFTDAFFYDKRSKTLPEQIHQVILSKKEFGTNVDTIVYKINKSSEYLDLFKNIYGKNEINAHMITDALSAFVAAQTFVNSDFDKYMRHDSNFLNNSAKQGFNLFLGKGNCATCHYPPTFSGLQPPYFKNTESHNLGVPVTNYFDDQTNIADNDLGIFQITKNKSEKGFFKTSTVRNSAHTFPYMHNGVYKNLTEVMTFYNVGGGIGLDLESTTQSLNPQALQLAPDEKDDIIAFINALSDIKNCSKAPLALPKFENEKWNKRKIGGEY